MALITNIYLAIFVFLGDLALISWGADKILDQIGFISKKMLWSPSVLAIILLGVDLEETAASISATINGFPEIAIGNVIGNSIITLCVCFALPGLFYVISFHEIKKAWLTFAFLFSLGILIAIVVPQLMLYISLLQLIGYLGFFLWNVKNLRSDPKSPRAKSTATLDQETKESDFKLIYVVLLSILSIAALGFGAELLLRATEFILEYSHLSQAFMGLMIIAAATNIEEYFILFQSIKKKHPEIGLGALMGKLLWNLGLNYGISGIIIGSTAEFSTVMVYNGIILALVAIPYLIYVALRKKALTKGDALVFFGIFSGFVMVNLFFMK